jgi:hypothetical protein
MLADLSSLLDEYYKVNIEKMHDWWANQNVENLFEIYEGVLLLILNPEDGNKLKILSKEVEKLASNLGLNSSMSVDRLRKLIDGLKENEEEFYKEVLNSSNPNFLMTTYYSLYLRFVTTVYLKLHKTDITNPNIKTKDSKIKDMFNIANFLVGFFGMPILIYIKKKEVFPYISELSGILLHALVTMNGG